MPTILAYYLLLAPLLGLIAALITWKRALARESLLAESPPDLGQAPTFPVDDAATVLSASAALLAQQSAPGNWQAPSDSGVELLAERVLTLRALSSTTGLVDLEDSLKRRRNSSSGAWSSYPQGPPDIDASLKSYLALLLAGESPDAEHMKAARTAIESLGGIEASSVTTRVFLAIFGACSWWRVPILPPEIILLPSWHVFNIYRISAWCRLRFVPLSILWATAFQLPTTVTDFEPPFKPSFRKRVYDRSSFGIWQRFFHYFELIFIAMDRLGITRLLRRKALNRAEQWIAERSQTYSLPFDQTASALALIAILALRKKPSQIEFRKIEAAFLRETSQRDTQGLIIASRSSRNIFDTANSINSLIQSGLSTGHPAIKTAASWLLTNQSVVGDWQIEGPRTSGGWPLAEGAAPYPNCAVTAEVIVALQSVYFGNPEYDARRQVAIRAASSWLIEMQNSDGGWGCYDKDCTAQILLAWPALQNGTRVLDPSSEDVTARVLVALDVAGYGNSEAAINSEEFLLSQQTPTGRWYGGFGINYIYGTWLVLEALRSRGKVAYGERAFEPCLRAATWLLSTQNPDGGWGETPESYEYLELAGVGASNPIHTAWAMMGLMATGLLEELRPDDEPVAALRHAAQFLKDTQRPDGYWPSSACTVVWLPQKSYERPILPALYYPLRALTTYDRLTFEHRSGRGALRAA